MSASPYIVSATRSSQSSIRSTWPEIPVVPSTTPPWARQDEVMKPDPQVPQQQADHHVPEPHVELLRRRPNPALVHLPIARLDPEPFPVRLLHPVDPPGGDPPVHVDPCVALPPAMPVHPPPPLHAAADRGLVLLAVLEGVAEPPALLLLLEDVRPRWGLWDDRPCGRGRQLA